MMLAMATPGSKMPQAQMNHAGEDSDDDSDVAFAYMNFDGVDFGDEEKCNEGNDETETLVKENTATGKPAKVKDDEQCFESTNETKENCKVVAKESSDASPADVPESLLFNNAASSYPIDAKSTSDQSQRKKYLSSIVLKCDPSKALSESDQRLLSIEKDLLLPRPKDDERKDILENAFAQTSDEGWIDVKLLFDLLEEGKYAEVLRSQSALVLFGSELENEVFPDLPGGPSMTESIKTRIFNLFDGSNNKSTYSKCLELEIIGISSLNLFLQLNYTGPSLDRGLKPEEGNVVAHPLDGINPHGMFKTLAMKEDGASKNNADQSGLQSSSNDLMPVSEVVDSNDSNNTKTHENEKPTIHSLKYTNTSDTFHNAVLAELAVDGEWPFQVCQAPYFLLFARAILSALADPAHPFRSWTESSGFLDTAVESNLESLAGLEVSGGSDFVGGAKFLSSAKLWNARAVVAHRRLIQTRKDDDDGAACQTLWNEVEAMFSDCLASFCENNEGKFDDERRKNHISGSVMLEWGLAQHHFRKIGRGKKCFNKALELSKLNVEVTGAEGKRTKYQKKATAQYLVRAKPAASVTQTDPTRLEAKESTPKNEESSSKLNKKNNAHIEAQMIKHDDVSDDALLLEKIKFEEEDDNVHYSLSMLDQSILLALCLDVKNDNPMDGLTGEQMGAYLARVLNQHDDWMIYSTSLLERAWLECERTHGRERAILQIQALADQHSNRLTLTQSTFQSVEEDSAPAQERLRNLHGIVYPPRWDMLRDLAERYAKLGIVTSAAEIFEEVELWDEVVECYRHAGKESKAEEVVRKRLAERETPRMYAALGDLTQDPKYYQKSLELSHGKFYDAHVALGKHFFEKGDLKQALKHFLDGLEIRPLMPAVWFRVGTIGMQLKEWDTALRAFSEVVQQEPEEGDAWANVAAIHMYRKNPAEAYPALLESLKQNRNNWRVWVSKLYTCIDLKKYDEAIQACDQLLDMKGKRNSSEGIPPLEEKCIRAIAGGVLQNYRDARMSSDNAALDSSKRTLSRLGKLFDKMDSTVKSEAWFYEISAHLKEALGLKEDALNDLMKEYRAMQTVKGWETNPAQCSKIAMLLESIYEFHREEVSKENLNKCKFLISGVVRKIRAAYFDSDPPKEVAALENMIAGLENRIASLNK